MAILTSVINYFARPAENSVTMTLGGSIASGATTVPVNGMGNYSDGDIVVFTVDAATPALKQVFTGTVSGSNVVNVVWTEGTNQPHTNGASVIDYVSATTVGMMSLGIQKQHNQNGTHSNVTATSVTATTVTATNFVTAGTPNAVGWTPIGGTLNTITANGNRSYTCVFNGVDLTSTVSAGMRLKITRTTPAPTQSTSLNGTTQYYSKTSPAGMSFTNNFVVSAWVKISSYAASDMEVVTRYNGTSGFSLAVNGGTGQIKMTGINGGAGNYSYVVSYQSIPLNKWVHIAAQLDMATFTATPTTSYTMINGLDVPATVSRGGTNPTALVQAGNLEIGSWNGGLQPFHGNIAQVAIYSAKVAQATVLASMNQTLAGNEASLISAYSFNGIITDLNANANNLTANGSALATATDSPFGLQADGTTAGTTEYGIIMKTAFSTNTTLTVQVPEGNAIPTSGGVSAVSYSIMKVPYGMPTQRAKWQLSTLGNGGLLAQASPGSTVYNLGSRIITVPTGEWEAKVQAWVQSTGSSVFRGGIAGLSTANNTLDPTSSLYATTAQTFATDVGGEVTFTGSITATTPTIYYFNVKDNGASTTNLYLQEANMMTTIVLENAYL